MRVTWVCNSVCNAGIPSKYRPNIYIYIYIYKHPINPKYIKQWIINHFKTYIRLGTFRYNCVQGQLNNEGGGKLHEIKRNRDKAKTDKETISFE